MEYSGYLPPYTRTDKMIDLVGQISEIIGSISVIGNMHSNPQLRRENQIKTIHASLAIENNTLSLGQVTDIVNGKRVLGAPQEIQEVKNAYEAYELLLTFNPYSIEDLLRAHGILMNSLTSEAGVFRSSGVGVFAGKQLVHMAPPANLVPKQIFDLFHWTEGATLHPLIKSCVFHYEFEFIHPFTDGNGRMGRMWQTLILYQWKKLFAWLPAETLIKERQQEYYNVLGEADKDAESTKFIEYMLNVILDALREVQQHETPDTYAMPHKVKKLLGVLGNEPLSATKLMEKLGLSRRATLQQSYLAPALKLGLIEMTVPDKPRSRNQKYRYKL